MYLFVRGDRRFKPLEEVGLERIMPRDALLLNLVNGPETSGLFKKLFVDWYQNEQSPTLLAMASDVVSKAELRELVPVMLKRLGKKDTPGFYKMNMLKHVAKFGDIKLLEHIEPLLTDKTVIYTQVWRDPQGERRLTHLVVADIALSVCWIWAGQKQEDLNTVTKILGEDDALRSDFCFCTSFEDEFTREAAHAKWKKLRAGMKK